MIAVICIGLTAILAADGCEVDVLIVPERIVANDNSRSHPPSYLIDKSVGSYWKGSEHTETVQFYLSGEVLVKEVVLIRHSIQASTVKVWWHGIWKFGDNSITVPYYYKKYSWLRFDFYYSGGAAISQIDVYGCYVTTTPTASPTTEELTRSPTSFPTTSPTVPPTLFLTTSPTEPPTIIPTISPTVPPISAHPTITPSTFPSSAPTARPSVATPSSYPSTLPSSSPTEPPSPVPSTSPSFSPTAVETERGLRITLGESELLVIVIIIFVFGVLFCAVLHCRKVRNSTNDLHKEEDFEMHVTHTVDIDEVNTIMATKDVAFDAKIDTEMTTYKEGENADTESVKLHNYKGDEQNNGRTGSPTVAEGIVNFSIGLDQVISDL